MTSYKFDYHQKIRIELNEISYNLKSLPLQYLRKKYLCCFGTMLQRWALQTRYTSA